MDSKRQLFVVNLKKMRVLVVYLFTLGHILCWKTLSLQTNISSWIKCKKKTPIHVVTVRIFTYELTLYLNLTIDECFKASAPSAVECVKHV